MPEHDQPDPSLIIQGSRVSRPAKRFGEDHELTESTPSAKRHKRQTARKETDKSTSDDEVQIVEPQTTECVSS
jgi:hypothetical protein